MLGQAPGRVRLEHVVLEYVVLGVCPVVGDLPRVVVTHHVDALGRGHGDQLPVARAAVRVGGVAATAGSPLGLGDEPVHSAAIDVRGRGAGAVGTPGVLLG